MVFWIAIFGMVCWGIAPVFAKLGLKNVNPLAGLLIRTMIAASLVALWIGLSGSIEQIVRIPLSSWLFIGIEAMLATVVGDLAYYAAIKNGDVSIVSIIMSASPLVTMICSNVFLGEPLTCWRIMGAGCIIVGLILIT